MKVLFQIRPDYLKSPAGDTVQMMETGRGLKNLGVEVSLATDPNVDLSPYDLIHIFNLTRIKESYMYFMNAQKQKKKVVVSPIYWNPHFFLRRDGTSPNSLALWNHMQPMRSRVLQEADLLLPNSEIEMNMLRHDFKDLAPYLAIPNGFPDDFIHADPQAIRDKVPHLPLDYILCVARISPRKNQVSLAKASQSLQLPLVLVGPINDRAYFEKVRSLYPDVIYLGSLQGSLLASTYAAAKAHALPSWFETPGLSSLEAAACGTVVITTDQGSPHEYFKDMALYVHPNDEKSLQQALEKSLKASPAPLTQHIREHYPWTKVAKRTLDAYHDLLD